jgi:ribosome-binding protein aMBF1 (putative translation factor)
MSDEYVNAAPTIILKKTAKQIKEDPCLRHKASLSTVIMSRPNAVVSNARMLDEHNDAGTIEKVSIDVSKAIQQGRLDKKLSQKDLGAKINERPNIIGDYESGKAIPNQQVLSKMERILGIKLRGKDIGSPLRMN